MHKLFNKKFECTGCSACADICPKTAIKMKPDEQGFCYPNVDENLCVNCGLCEKVCQINSPIDKEEGICFGVKNSDNIRNASSSGGVFTALSDYIISNNGVSVGAAFDENMKVKHFIAKDIVQRNSFRGSKYVQSDTDGVYKDVVSCLKKKVRVLFTGTPCQCAALKQYLKTVKQSEESLVIVDIVCHGVPSPQIWADHVCELEKKYKSKLVKYSFRNKEKGWRNYHIKAEFENGMIDRDSDDARVFVKFFSANIMLRPSCYYCQYCSIPRVSDITMGDFWGIEEIDHTFTDNKGISMLLINTEKGQKLWNEINRCLEFKEYPTSVLSQPNLYSATNYGKDYDNFWRDYSKRGYRFVATKYGGGVHR